MRYLLQPQSTDAMGNALAGVTYKAYPHATAKAALSQDAQAVWSVNVGALPAAATVFASDDSAVNTAVTLTSQADGTTVAGYLDAGLYTLVGTTGARNFVIPLFEAGTIISAAIGTTVAANDDLAAALGKIVTKLEANEAALQATVESNVTLLSRLGTNMPTPVGTVPAYVAAYDVADYGGAEVIKVEHDNGYIHYESDGTVWSETGRVVKADVAEDPTTMKFVA